MEQRELLKSFLIITLLVGFGILLTLSIKTGCAPVKTDFNLKLSFMSALSSQVLGLQQQLQLQQHHLQIARLCCCLDVLESVYLLQ